MLGLSGGGDWRYRVNKAAIRLGGSWGAVAAGPGGCKRAYWILAYFDSKRSWTVPVDGSDPLG